LASVRGCEALPQNHGYLTQFRENPTRRQPCLKHIPLGVCAQLEGVERRTHLGCEPVGRERFGAKSAGLFCGKEEDFWRSGYNRSGTALQRAYSISAEGEWLEKRGLELNSSVILGFLGVILAAGGGTKFWPFNEVRNKCAFPIANVPVVRRIAEDLVGMGFQRILVVVGHGEASVRHALHGLSPAPEYVRQPSASGTAPAVAAAWDLAGDEDILVVYGDVVTPASNIKAVVEYFRESGAKACVLLQPLGDEKPGDWICGEVAGGRLIGVQGHPRGGEYRLGGVVALGRGAASAVRDNPGLLRSVPVGGMPPTEADLAASLQLLIDDGCEVAAVVASEFLVDLDRPWHILEANARLLDYMSSRLEGTSSIQLQKFQTARRYREDWCLARAQLWGTE
jgi:NDP-sugar pyrophosphorylase family protein